MDNTTLEQRGKRYILISIILSLVSVATTLYINVELAVKYTRVDAKTKVMFGMIESLQFGYDYYDYVAIIGLAALIFALLSLKNNTKRNRSFIAIVFSLFAIAIVFLRIWRLFVL
jgi:hypothetical protein